MSIYGTRPPKFIVDGNTINFDYVFDVKLSTDDEYLVHIDELAGNKYSELRHTHVQFEFKMNLYKYSDNDIMLVRSKFNEIYSKKGEIGVLYPFRDGDALKNNQGNDAQIMLKTVNSYFLDNVEFRDGLIIKFESMEPVKLDNIASSLQLSEIIMSNDN